MDERNCKELYKHKFIVFCYDHYNPLGIIRSLGEKGIRAIVILNCKGKTARLIPSSKYPQIIHKVNSIEEGFNLLLSKYGQKKYKPFIYSSSDDICELLDKNYELLIDKFFFFHGKEEGIVSKYLNKDSINSLAIQKGCNVLFNEVVNKGDLPDNIRYPVVTKAMISTLYAWKKEMHICNTPKELLQAYKDIRSDTILVQEYIEKKNELCLDGFSFNAGNDVYIPYYTNYLRFSKMSYGGYMVLRPFNDEIIYNQIKEILKEVGYTGIFEAEFLVDKNGKKWFLEVNFRNSTWSYAYTYGGWNMPYLWAIGTLQGSIKTEKLKRIKEFTAMSEEEDYDISVKSGMISFKEWFEDYKRADVHYLTNKKDPWPYTYKLMRRTIKAPVMLAKKLLEKGEKYV